MARLFPLVLTLLCAQAVAGEVKSLDVLYSTEPEGSILREFAEFTVKTSGSCSLEPISTSGKVIDVLLKNCSLTRTYNVGARGGLVQSAVLKPVDGSSELLIKLKKSGVARFSERPGELKVKVLDASFIKPRISVVKTVRGEALLISLPTSTKFNSQQVGNKLFIRFPSLKFVEEAYRPTSQLVERVAVTNTPQGGVVELDLSPSVKAAEVVPGSSGGVAVRLYATNAAQATSLKPSPAASSGTVSDRGPKIALKFTNADVRAVVRAITSVAGVNVVFDPEVKGTVNVDFEKPVYWKDALKAVLEPLNLTYIETPEYLRILPKSKIIKEQKLEPVKTYVIPVSYVSADSIMKDLKGIIKGDNRETIEVNKDTNALILKVTPTHYREILKVVKAIDHPSKQVLVKAKIVQLSAKAEKDLGFTWFISGYNRLGDSNLSTYTAGSYGFNTAGYTPLISPDTYANVSKIPVMDSTLALGILNKAQTLRVELALKALEVDGDAQIISSPKVLTLDNQEASIEQGIEIPYRESTVGAGGATSYRIAFKKASLILKVKPHIIKDNNILLDIEVRKDSPNYDYVAITGGNEPAINTRNVKSRVMIRNGDTVVIGGIYEKERSKSQSGVPVLSRIPLLGWLFKNQTVQVTKSKLLIFITPVLINSEGNVEGGK